MEDRGRNQGGVPHRNFFVRHAAVLLLLVLVIGFGGVFMAPKAAQAFPGEALAAAAWKEIRDSLRNLANNLNTIRKEALKTTYDITYKNTLRLYLARIAEDTAVWVASAGTGQKPLFITDPHYYTRLNDAAAGDFIARISTQMFGVTVRDPGTNEGRAAIQQIVKQLHSPSTGAESCTGFCNALNEERELQAAAVRELIAQLDTKYTYAPEDRRTTEVQCPLDGVVAGAGPSQGYTLHWDAEKRVISFANAPTYATEDCYRGLQEFITQLKTEATATFQACTTECKAFNYREGQASAAQSWSNLRTVQLGSAINSYYSLQGNDFGIALELYEQSVVAGREAEQAMRDVTPPGGTTPIISPVSNEVTVPSTLVEEKAKQPIQESTTAEKIQTGSPVADAIGIFSNTLVQKLTERIFKGKCGLNPASCNTSSTNPGVSALGSLLFGGQRLTGIAAAQLQFASLTKIQYAIGTPAENRYSSVDELSSQGILDSRFAQAIEEKLTVQEAINQGLLDGGRTFGFDRQGNDAANGYSYRSIIYMRRARIVPVGWELAAEWIQQYSQGKKEYSLREVVGAFYDCGDETGLNASPFCGLVDPNWVLKAPEQYCRRSGAGDEVLSREFVCDEDTNSDGRINCSSDAVFGGDIGRWVLQRNDNQCVDIQDCVVENDDGSCLAFGYCYEEKPIWRFDGEACPAYYASCLTYQDSQGTDVSYLADTVNVDSCTADNAGCTAYCGGNSYWGASNLWTCTANTGDIVFADNDIEPCRSSDAGCHEYIRTEDGTNLIPNASFEYFTGTINDDLPDGFNGWTGSGDAVTTGNTALGQNNTTAIQLTGSIVATIDTGAPVAGQSFALSYSGRAATAATCTGGFTFRAGTYNVTIPAEYGTSWQRYAGVFTVPETATADNSIDMTINAGGCSVQVDNTQATVGVRQYGYTDYGATSRIYLNTAEPNLVVNGDFSNDIGNDFYRNQDNENATAGDEIPDGWVSSGGTAITTEEGYDDTTSIDITDGGWVGQDIPVTPGSDYVVSGWIKTDGVGSKATIRTECVGSSHTAVFDPECELWSDTGVTVINPEFSGNTPWTYVQYRITANKTDIPFVRVLCYHFGGGGDTFCDNVRLEEAPPSLLCEPEDVGCDLYTAKEDGNQVPGITTAGDVCPADAVGCKAYQEVGIDHIPVRPTDDPLYLKASTGQQCNASAVGCEEYTNIDILAQGGEAREYYSSIKQCVQPSHSVVAGNPDANLFYSWVGTAEEGYQLRKWNLLKSNVDNGPCTNLSVGTTGTEPTCEDNIKPQATCTAAELVRNPDCVEFFDQNAQPFYRLASQTVTVSDACSPYRNTLDDAAGEDKVYYIIGQEATRCSASQAFCREYKGSTGNNNFTVFEDNFEDGDAVGWSPTNISFESLSGGGHSLSTGAGTVASYSLTNLVQQGQSYIVRLWAKGFGDSIRASLTGSFGTVQSDPAPLTKGEWNTYTLGPIVLDHAPAVDEALRIDLGGGGFIDNVELIGNSRSVYMIQGTADTCDAANVNCAAYTDRTGNIANLKSFTRLCSTKAVGCEALIDTQNSESPFSQVAHGKTTPADRVMAIINDSRRSCSPQAAACEAFGIPAYDGTGNVTGHATTYLKNDPDSYQSALCEPEANFCEQYTVKDTGSVAYFKDPVTTSCEYRESQTYLGEKVSGWFITNTNELCPSYNLWCKIGTDITPAVTAAQQSACASGATVDGDGLFIYPTTGYTPLDKIFCTTDSRINCNTPEGINSCLSTAPESGRCVAPGPPSSVCAGGTNNGLACRVDDDCPDASVTDVGTCTTVYTGVCTTAASGCNAYRDPLDPVGCEVQCNRELDAIGEDIPVNSSCSPDANGTSGCQTYTYIKSSVDQRSTACNNQVNFDAGCRPFFDASNPSTLFNITNITSP